MARLVARKRFTSKKGDLPMVIALNTRTILSIFRDMKKLEYVEVGWGDDEAVQLAEVLPLCTSATVLSLSLNKISDRGAKALAAAFAEGAMPKLEKLALNFNQIGDEGAVALAEAVGKGALPELERLYLLFNKLSQTAEDAWEAVKAKRSGLDVNLEVPARRQPKPTSPRRDLRPRVAQHTDAMKRDTSTCPKSDEGVRSAVKQGALVISLGGGAKTVADELREAFLANQMPATGLGSAKM